MLGRITFGLALCLALPARADEVMSYALKSGLIELTPGTADVLRVGRSAKSIIIGNSDIVEAVMFGSVVTLTAKTTGSTNVIVLDEHDEEIFRGVIQIGPKPVGVQVLSGGKLQSFSCMPRCMPVPGLLVTGAADKSALTSAASSGNK